MINHCVPSKKTRIFSHSLLDAMQRERPMLKTGDKEVPDIVHVLTDWIMYFNVLRPRIYTEIFRHAVGFLWQGISRTQWQRASRDNTEECWQISRPLTGFKFYPSLCEVYEDACGIRLAFHNVKLIWISVSFRPVCLVFVRSFIYDVATNFQEWFYRAI